MSNNLSLSMDMEPDDVRDMAYHMLEAAEQHSGSGPIGLTIRADGDYELRPQSVIKKGDDHDI